RMAMAVSASDTVRSMAADSPVRIDTADTISTPPGGPQAPAGPVGGSGACWWPSSPLLGVRCVIAADPSIGPRHRPLAVKEIPVPDAPTDRSSEPALLDQAVVERVLGAGLARGADFAEVFVEDRRSSSALLDDGRVEELTSGRDRGAGIRVVVGDSTGFAHTSDLSEAGLIAAAEAAAAASRGAGGSTLVVDLDRVDAPAPNAVAILPGDVPKARKVELLLT